jgi:hypothetical protein
MQNDVIIMSEFNALDLGRFARKELAGAARIACDSIRVIRNK